MALFFCAIFQMLILLCEAFDARAAADAQLMAAPAPRDGAAGIVLTAPRRALPGTVRTPRLALAPEVQDKSPKPDDIGFGAAEPRPETRWRAWAPHPGRDWPVSWAFPGGSAEKRGSFPLGFSTPISLRYRN